jgi:hypothetical protein
MELHTNTPPTGNTEVGRKWFSFFIYDKSTRRAQLDVVQGNVWNENLSDKPDKDDHLYFYTAKASADQYSST